MKNSEDLILLFRTPMCTRKKISEVYRQFGHALSESFASPALMHSAPISNEQTLHQRICFVCQNIFNRPGNFDRVRQSMIRHVHARIDSGGANFEHIL